MEIDVKQINRIKALIAKLEAEANRLRPTGLRRVSGIDYRVSILKRALKSNLKRSGLSE